MGSLTKTKLFNLLLNGIINLTSILHSYTLYILFLCFFTSYILKIIYFLSPLFITTSLLLISLITAISPVLVKDTFFGIKSSKFKANYLILFAYDAVSRLMQPKTNDEDVHSLEALEMYKSVFDTPMLDERGNHVDVSEKYPEEKILQTIEYSEIKISEDGEHDCYVKTEEAIDVDIIFGQGPAIDDSKMGSIKSVINKYEGFLKKSCTEETKKVQTEINQIFDEQNSKQLVKVVQYDNSRRHSISKSKNSQSMKQCTTSTINVAENNRDISSKDDSFRQSKSDLGKYGSMRKEREWRSTLACKLFEEKHNSRNMEGIECMDSLWEKYDEGESINGNSKKEMMKTNSSTIKNNVKYEYGEEYEEEDELVGRMCCLQAFKLATTKMNLGVGRRNLAKISKAVKGFGWMHKASKHSKKVHNNNG